jgi:hypothetical protein
MSLCIFVSHNSKYADLAQSLRRSLEVLDRRKSEERLTISISEEMAGAKDWRKWIEENVCNADIFLLIYPDTTTDMSWCHYEFGRFNDERAERHVVCLKNTNISKPPPAFDPYQAYTADEAGLGKFLNELFVRGTFTSGQAINGEVADLGSETYEKARNITQELADKFAQARVQKQLYERSIVISLPYPTDTLDIDNSIVEGNVEGLRLLHLRPDATLAWSELREKLGADAKWVADLERALPTMATAALPPSLSPFLVWQKIYFPVIIGADSIDNTLQKLRVIFVEADADELRPLLDWATPRGMPTQFASLIRLFRMFFRARWDVVEPLFQEVKFRAPSKERCEAIVTSVVETYARMSREAAARGFDGFEKFFAIFDSSLRREVDATTTAYADAMNALKDSSPADCEETEKLLRGVLDNNAEWLSVAAKQLAIFVGDLRHDV